MCDLTNPLQLGCRRCGTSAPTAIVAVLGFGQSVSGWQSPVIGFSLMGLAGLMALVAIALWSDPGRNG